ncbi:MFS transporter [Streptosporangium pseudovulgare]|uniref:MFS transporter n=1 Tax=Streptosporangium pseudovulgare TaxID=35765 RepID=A0ABQ2R4L4_9ACTN|nr:MFS transporter [Streptosporangium pseudovulgare]GGQ13587.1 MFS transporter [Streptosporangium pseudovulgare]
MHVTTPNRTVLTRARIAVYLLFTLAGIAIGTWTARIPSIKEGLDLSDGRLSLGLLGIAAGAITGMQVVGRLIDRHGSATVMIPMAFAQGVVLILPAHAPGLTALAATLFAFGLVHGTLDVAMNANAVEVEQAANRPLMSSFHAAFSIGGFLGATAGGLLAQAGLTPAATFTATAAVLTLMALWAARWALPRSAAPSGHPAGPAPAELPGTAGPAARTTPETTATTAAAAETTPATATEATPESGESATSAKGTAHSVLALGVLAICCMIGEGAAADWSSVYLRDSLGSSAGFAAAAYAAFSVMMTAGRLAGDRLTARFGAVALVRGCGALAATGLGAGLLAGNQVIAVLGFACFGAGLSCIIPQVFSAAGRRDPARAGQALARVASLGYAGFLAGPILIGGLAEVIGLPLALAVPALLAGFVALSAVFLRTPSFTK